MLQRAALVLLFLACTAVLVAVLWAFTRFVEEIVDGVGDEVSEHSSQPLSSSSSWPSSSPSWVSSVTFGGGPPGPQLAG